MNQSVFVPINELENKLVSALEGNLTGEEFIKRLLLEQVYMPIQDEVHATKGLQRPSKAQPLLVEDEEGSQVLILFTSPGRAKEFVDDYPDYGGGLLTDFSWVLSKLDSPVYVAINPGFDAGFDLHVDIVADLMSHLPKEIQ